MSYTAVRRLQFCAGHRVHKHESKCNNMHGHNYVMYIHARPKKGLALDALGRVIDFSVIKAKCNDWIQDKWDHGFIYFFDDIEVAHALDKLIGHKQKKYGMSTNPTAENMAGHFLNVICPGLFEYTDVEIYKIVLWETENCFVEVELD
jgi:6-pyruvoyltetrahydropterin/6-carboxytetrahydropterin synthase